MGYISKSLILKCYQILSSITLDHKQGQTQIVSAIRHFFALDMFFKRYDRNCDFNNPIDRNEFVANVKRLVNIKDDFYTTNFYTTIKSIDDCGVGSNFTSVGVINNSKHDPINTFEYPTRGQHPLFNVRNAVGIRNVEYYPNINNYLHTKEFRSAFAIWILRNDELCDLSVEEIKKALSAILTSELIRAFLPTDDDISLFIGGEALEEHRCLIEKDELLELFKSTCMSKVTEKYRPYLTAIKSKPFLLLAGISGTGKSRIVRELARACWDVDSEEYKAQKPRNFEMVQVKPNWHDSSELIGYVSRIDSVRYVIGPFLRFMVKAIKDPDTPYFLCLDEMNLAPVEQYFAEYLSVVESRKRQDDGSITTDPIVDYSNTEEYHSLISQLFDDDEERKAYLKEEGGKRLSIPQNLIVVGTVNMDETTFSFSRKVLDRAMTIEMNEVDLYGGLKERHEQIGKLGAAELIGDAVEGVDVYAAHKDVCDIAINYLQKINDKLEGTPFKVAYRTRNEVLLYVVNNLPYNKDEDGKELEQGLVIARALDEITNMKILPRIEGDETKVSNRFLEDLQDTIHKGLNEVYGDDYIPDEEGKNAGVSYLKLEEMKKRLESGYTSFWS